MELKDYIGHRVKCLIPDELMWYTGTVTDIFCGDVVTVMCDSNPYGSVVASVRIENLEVLK